MALVQRQLILCTQNTVGRILSIDYGKKRCGIAVTDPLKIIPGGLATVDTSALMAFLDDYLRRETVERIVVGEPRQPNGEPSENYARVKSWAGQFGKLHPEVPLEFYDERFTSVLAHRAMIDGGMKKSGRMDKNSVDKISAAIILQSWMDKKVTL